jgi:CDP-6-deoxy-D-xylo-4-hexulose-3-dehydrase
LAESLDFKSLILQWQFLDKFGIIKLLMIKLVKSSFYREAETKRQLAEFIIKTDIFSMGRECKKFEAAFAKKQQCRFAVFVSSGSMANLVLIQSLLNLGKLKPGDRIGFSSLTWSTNIMPLIQLRLVPVPLDCELSTLNVSPALLKKEITNLRGLFLTNALGFCDNIAEIKNLCAKHNVLLIEDNCESLGSKTQGILLGNFGLASTFSFFVGHHLSAVEGGMICTDNKELYEMLLTTRAHGWDRNLPEASQRKLRRQAGVDNFYAKYTFYDLAYNARPTEIQGFLGNRQIGYWDVIIKTRQSNFKFFQKATERNNKIIPLRIQHFDVVSNFAMPVIFKNKVFFKKYIQRFQKAGVEIRPIIAGDMTRQPFYKKYIKKSPACPNAAHVHSCGFYFPNNPELTKAEVKFLCDLLKP